MEGGQEFGSGRTIRDFHCFRVIPLPGLSPSWSSALGTIRKKEKRTGNGSQKSTIALGSLSSFEVKKGCGQTLHCRGLLEPSFRPSLVLKCILWAFWISEFLNLPFPYLKFLPLKTCICISSILKINAQYTNTFLEKKSCVQRKPPFITTQKPSMTRLFVIEMRSYCKYFFCNFFTY